MLKKILLIFKKIIVGLLLLYAFNVIIFPINAVIPMNIFTIIIVSVFGLPGIVGICLFSIFIL